MIEREIENTSKKDPATPKAHDGLDKPLPGRKPSNAFHAALAAVRMASKKAEK